MFREGPVNPGPSNRTVLMIRHMRARSRDRVASGLTRRGLLVEWCCPAEGQSLPPADPERFAAVVVYGGAQSANDDSHYIPAEIRWIEQWLKYEAPLFGICLGGQLLARALGGTVGPHPDDVHEIGYHPIRPTPAAGGFLAADLHVYQWHGEGFTVPDGSTLLAAGDAFPNQAFRFQRAIYGIQFHPEVTPDIVRKWFDEAGDHLDRKGAHSITRQLADMERFDMDSRDWLEQFLDRWITEWSERASAEPPAT